MIRNLKVLLLAALAVTAVGAIGASGAQAHSAKTSFTNIGGGNAILTVTTDGTTTTAHQVFDVPGNGAITCEHVELFSTIEGLSPGTIKMKESGAGFTTCTFLGQKATVTMNGCEFSFTPAGTVGTICPVGNVISFSAAGCTVKVRGGQSFANAAKYENVGTEAEMQVTVEVATGEEIHTEASGVGCITTGTTTKGRYTTGNVIIDAYEDPASGIEGAKKQITVD